MDRENRSQDQDRTARARIRDAAIRRFAAEGFAAVSVKTIATDAGVSAPLVIHHFGSKEGLRAECDHYVNEQMWAMKRRLGEGLTSDPLQSIRQAQGELPLLEYLARTIPDGTEHVAALIDSMVDDTLEFMARAEGDGLMKPGTNTREKAVVLVLWQLGALVLHEHAKRLLGADLTGPSEETLNWWLPAGEILAHGVIDPAQFDAMRTAAQAGLSKLGQSEQEQAKRRQPESPTRSGDKAKKERGEP